MKFLKYTSYFVLFLFLNLITQTKILAFEFSENFDSYSTGEITAQSNWEVGDAPYINAIVKNNTYSSSPNSLNFDGRSTIIQDFTTTTPNELYVSLDIYKTSGSGDTHFTIWGNTGELLTVYSYSAGQSSQILLAQETIEIIEHEFEEWENIKIRANYDGTKYHYKLYLNNSLIKEGDTSAKTKRELTYIQFASSGSGTYATEEYFDNLVVATNEDIPLDDTRTRIIEIIPANKAIIATTTPTGATTTLSVEYYINEEDVGIFNTVKVIIEHLDQNATGLGYSPYRFDDNLLPVAGTGIWDREIFLPIGNYSIEAQIVNSTLGGYFYNPLEYFGNSIFMSQDDSNLLAQYHQYVVGTSTVLGAMAQGHNDEFESILAGTSTGATLADCNILSGFDFAKCMAFSFIPSKKQLTDFSNKISQGLFTKFPIGYIWSIATILNSTTTTPLPTINATIPNGVVGTGENINLSIKTDALNYIYNATTSQFTNESVDGEVTFYEFTYFYWKILVYFAVFSYIFTRILGTGVFSMLGDMFETPIYTKTTAHGRKRKNVRGKYYQEWNKADITKAMSKGDHNKSEML